MEKTTSNLSGNRINIQHHKTKIGELILGSFDDHLCLLDFKYRKMRTTVDNRIKIGLKADFLERNDATLTKTKEQLDEYLSGNRKEFDIPLLMVGTDFQKRVWNRAKHPRKYFRDERSVFLPLCSIRLRYRLERSHGHWLPGGTDPSPRIQCTRCWLCQNPPPCGSP